MRRLVTSAAALAALCIAAPAAAIINGDLDGEQHPNVGGLVASEIYSDGTWTYCSGALIDPSVFLTSAHCGSGHEGTDRVSVTFDTSYQAGDAVHEGTWVPDPAYARGLSSPHDIAVVLLDEPVLGVEPADLPAAGSLDDLPKDQLFTSVGYGAYEVVNAPGGQQFLYDDQRRVSTSSTLNATNKPWLRISMIEQNGNGGTCNGDSGGPNFLGTTDTIAGLTTTGDMPCGATNVVLRLDTETVRDFLGQYVELP